MLWHKKMSQKQKQQMYESAWTTIAIIFINKSVFAGLCIAIFTSVVWERTKSGMRLTWDI